MTEDRPATEDTQAVAEDAMLDAVVARMVECIGDGDPNSDDARVCLLSNLPEVDGCTPKAVLLADSSCGGCSDAQEALDREGTPYDRVDTFSARGIGLVRQVEKKLVPQLLLVDCADRILMELELPGGDEDVEGEAAGPG